MYIESITIDGFKSYAQRVELSNFDQCFNAITGLNGTGKSNILDSICFVLGLSDLKQVRASNLQDLVYKQGQAGVNKATVCITFRNDDPEKGPAAYKDRDQIVVTRQIVIGGRNKYMINGHVAQPSRVQDLFHSVQLNVNNPHFLIMQGRITKVLNMKPAEILSLLEEACGTRMYEKKKEASQRIMEKKDKKLAEIDEVLLTQVSPELEKLRIECTKFYTYAEESAKVDRLKKFCVAFDYVNSGRIQAENEGKIRAMHDQVKILEQDLVSLQEDLRQKEAVVKALQVEKEIQSGGEVKELQAEVDELALQLARDNATVKNTKKTLAKENTALEQLEAGIKELDEVVLEQQLQLATASRDEAQQVMDAAEKAVEAATRELAGAEAGDGRDESNRSLAERLAAAKNDQTAADAEAKAAEISRKHLQKQLTDQRRQLSSKEAEAGKLQAEVAKHQKEVEGWRQKLQGLNFDEAESERLQSVVESERAAVRKCKEDVDRLAGGLSGFNFSYSDPYAGFDRGQVKGALARLVRLKTPRTALALEVAAGGRLYSVVVDNEKIGKDLLQNGRLRNRVTIVPLSKIRFYELNGRQVQNAQRLVGEKAVPALDLVEYDQSVAPAVKYAFGSTFVCEDSGAANKVAFSRDISARSVTLEGDDYNPAGTLSGGSRKRAAPVLARLTELVEAEEKLEQHQAVFREAEEKLAGMGAAARHHREAKQQLELKEHALSLLEQRVAGSESAQLAAAVAATEGELEAAAAALTAAVEKKESMVGLAKQLADEIKNFDRDRGARTKAAKARLSGAKKEVEAARKLLKTKEQLLQTAIAEKEAAEAERVQLEEQRAPLQAAIADLQAQVSTLEQSVAEAAARHKDVGSRLKTKKLRLRECDEDINAAVGEAEELKGRLEGVEKDKRKATQEQSGAEKAIEDACSHMAKLEEDFTWLAQEKQHFGRGDYDFEANDPQQSYQELEAAQRKVEELRLKGIDQNAQLQFESVTAQFNDLQSKRTVVENDRTKIASVIQELDDKKRTALQATWTQVNKDFGAIFSTLLPGTSAKLEPQEGKSFLEGLEVKVAFGTVWKESLTELSGGQRSLLALSLILALCRFKPAPLYILDEVDAALDLNHTQNIGRMIKEHFPESQFIVVSLKEGMFNNANVIFRTKFVDGVSNVMRTENNGIRNEKSGKSGRPAADNRPRAVLRDSNRG